MRMNERRNEILRQRILPCPLVERAVKSARFSCLVLGLLAVATSALMAQRLSAVGYQFSKEGQAVVTRMASFDSLAGNDWQYHEGSIAHGEQATPDSVAWKDVRIPFVASNQEVWIRRWVEVPKSLNGYDLTGARIWFYLEVGGDGPGHGYLYETIYANGKLIAEGTHLYKQVLIADAHPGDKVLLAVKMPPTLGEKHFDRVRFQVGFAEGRPNPDIVRTELSSAAALLPSITHDATGLAAQEKILDSAARAVNVDALDNGDQKAFDASLKDAQDRLEPLRPVMKKAFVTMTGNAHIDAAWLWSWTETVDQVHFTFNNVLQLMREYPQYVFSQSAAQYYEWMEQKFPFIFQQIQQRVKEGRWELVGGMWVEPDLNLPDGEGEVRQILVGKQYFQQKFGVDVKVGWNPDSFGYNWQLPQIYKKSGIDYFLTQKLNYNDDNILPLKLFWWQSPDGSRVLTYFPHDYVQNIEPVKMAHDLAAVMKANPGDDKLLHLYGGSLGRQGVPEGRDVQEAGVLWSDPDKVYPDTRFTTAQAFFDDMASRADTANTPVWNYKTFAAGETHVAAVADGKIHLPVWNDELYLEHHRGIYTTQALEKAHIRHSEEWLLDAEKYSALAWLGGLDYPGSQLTESWKRKSFNDFHDTAAGSGIADVYRDAEKEYDEIHRVTGDATRNALKEVDSHINTAAHAGVPVIVWNQLNWARTEAIPVSVQMPGPEPNGIAVVDASGKPVLMQVLSKDDATNTYRLLLRAQDVPPVGYTVLYAVAGQRKVASDLELHGTTMENSLLRVVLDPKTGCITSLYQKKTGVESIASGQCGNMLQAFVDNSPVEDAWNIDKDFEKYTTNLTMMDNIKVVEQGPLRAAIRITRTWSKSRFVQDIILDAGSPRVDVSSEVDWHETHVMLKAAFPLAYSSDAATYEIPFGSIERPTTRNNNVEDSKFEVPALRWADLGDSKNGFSLINEAKYGYDARGNLLRLTLLRSTVYPDPDADRGHQHFTYTLYPHAGTWKDADTVLRGYEFNYKLNAAQAMPHAGVLPASHSFVSIKPGNLVMTAMKKSEDGDGLILRFYESAGKQTQAEITLPAGATHAAETNLMEKGVEGMNATLPISNNKVELKVGPYSINTVRVGFGTRDEGFWPAQK